MTIGNNVSVHQIRGQAAGASEGLTTADQPFGGVLEPHVFFSRTALFAAGITHYRWSYQRLTASDGTTAVSPADGWHTMPRQVVRHYAVIDAHDNLTFPTDVMGPDPAFPGLDLFRIQPINPPAPGLEWYVADAREDTATAFFETHLLDVLHPDAAAGKYALKLELFKAGARVNITDAGITFKIPTIDAPFGAQTIPTVAAPDEYLIKESGKVVAFRMVVRVDNNHCNGAINAITGAGLSIDAECGMIRYGAGNSAQISFLAQHPHNFATFDFSTVRGLGTSVPEATASGAVGSSSVNGFTRDSSSVFSKSAPLFAATPATGIDMIPKKPAPKCPTTVP